MNEKDIERSGALNGLKVLDLTRVLAGPVCTMLLADMGAEVIKLEVPGTGDDSRGFPPFKEGESTYFINNNRNKKSIVLNLKDPSDHRKLVEIIKSMDVLVENFRPGTMEKLGLGYEDLKETKVTQPAIFLHSVILAKTLGDNFKPDMVAGHSLGEFSALVANGSLTFEDGLRLVSQRALAMQKACELQPSTMAAVLGLDVAIDLQDFKSTISA